MSPGRESGARAERTLSAAGDAVRVELAFEDGASGRILWRGVDAFGPFDLHCARGAARLGERRDEAGEDDLGPWRGVGATVEAPLPLRVSVRAYARQPLVVFRCEATRALDGLATGRLADPCVAWPRLRPAGRRPPLDAGFAAFGHQYTEFALPTFSDASLARFFLLPFRPAVVEPLGLLAPDGACLLLAPLDAFHEQVIAVAPPDADQAARREAGVRCGWHGDLDAVPEGFASELAVWAGPGPRRALDAWAACLRRRHGTRRPSRYADASVARLSYWTDNGAAYWYRTEPGHDVEGTLAAVAERLREERVPVGAFQLDSWFYPHAATRAFDAPETDVPPTPLLRWEPRPDALPGGVSALRRRLGDLPLVLHARHLASEAPYFAPDAEDGGVAAWHDGDRAHPVDPLFFDRLLAQAEAWGAVTFEQDWLVEMFLGVRGLRERPGRARVWQETVDRCARERGLSLQWCMATPADFLQTLTLERVTSIRTCGDYRYRIGSGPTWAWFLYTNALARALGLHPYKDVFLSRRDGEDRDGDPCAEAEAMLAALSAGPVGIGDRLGRTDRELVLRTCREDGLLVKPDLPLAALERCFRRHVVLHPDPLLAETSSAHPAGRWVYLASLNAFRGDETLAFRVALAELGDARPAGPVVVYDWRRGTCERLAPDGGIALELPPRDWDLRVLCPLLDVGGGATVFGDVARYACAGDRRLRDVRVHDGEIAFDVLGAPGERVEIRGWSADPLERPGGQPPTRDGRDGVWRLPVTLPARGWEPVRLRASGRGA